MLLLGHACGTCVPLLVSCNHGSRRFRADQKICPARSGTANPVQPSRAHCKGTRLQRLPPRSGTGDFATIPETAKCMACHSTVKKESAAIQRLAALHEQ